SQAVFDVSVHFAAALEEPLKGIRAFGKGVAEFVCEFDHGRAEC
ncbi:MAG: hypothetical protein ACI9JZ_001422, partial [Lentimonas sp.]